MQAVLIGSSCLMLTTQIGLEGYLMPKELLLHLCVAIVVPFVLLKISTISLTKMDCFLVLSFGTSALSAIFVSTNYWWAFRENAWMISAGLLFWTSRTLANEHKEHLLWTAGIAIIAAAFIAILEAKEILPPLSVPGRSPGGSFGNRNFLAHGLVLGTPLLIRMVMVVPLGRQVAIWVGGLLFTTSMVVVSRCRGAWLTEGVLSIAAIFLVISQYDQIQRVWLRVTIVVITMGMGSALALAGIMANPWKTENPYLDTAGRIFDYTAGTGKGRLIQYKNTLRMIAAHPLLGVGPGHWSAAYPEFATSGDPSWRPKALQPVNRFPNSDGLAVTSERGIPTTIFLICAAITLGITALKRAREKSGSPERSDGWLVIFTMAAAFLLGLTDSVLLRPEPIIFLAVVLGVNSGNLTVWKNYRLNSFAWPLAIGVMGMSLMFATYSGVRCYAGFLKLDRSIEATQKASVLDRGDYALGTYLAKKLYQMDNYEGAINETLRVLNLYPYSLEAQNLLQTCLRLQLNRAKDPGAR